MYCHQRSSIQSVSVRGPAGEAGNAEGAVAADRLQGVHPGLDRQLVLLEELSGKGRAGEESRVEGMEHGADDYLIKPFSARELLARVQTHLQMARVRKEAGEALRKSEEHAKSIVESIADGFMTLDREWRVTMVRMRLGSNNAGQAVFAETDPNGTMWPPHPQST